MSTVNGNALRLSLATEIIPVPTLEESSDFRIKQTGQKTHAPSGAPVLFFDVLDTESQRIGIASIVAGPDDPSLIYTGHVCATLSRERSEPDLLSRIGKALIQCAFEIGLTVVRIVVPTDDSVSVDSCRLLLPASASTIVDTQGMAHATFLFYPKGDSS